MKTISLKIDDPIFEETEKLRSSLNKARNRYINEAVDYYNKVQRDKLLKEKLKAESAMVRQDSIEVLEAFESIEYD